MTGQRWFLRTPAQYAAAPVGTQVWDDGGHVEAWWTLTILGWFPTGIPRRFIPVSLNAWSREVKRWGTNANHERACAEVKMRNWFIHEAIRLHAEPRDWPCRCYRCPR